MGSTAYGVEGNSSDIDVYSVCVPPRDYTFPHMSGFVPGFGPPPPTFTPWQKHHIKTEEGSNQEKEYDVCSYGIVDYFRLAAENNPNILDSLFVPDRCVTYKSDIGDAFRQKRRIFLHKGSYAKLKGYAYSQMKKIRERNPVGKRTELVEKFGYDVKFAYHVVRLINQAEQILMEGDLDLERCREQLKAIRRGEWTLDELDQWSRDRERQLDELHVKSDLRVSPDYEQLNALLMSCLESKYGSVTKMMRGALDTRTREKYEAIRKIVES